MSRTASSSSSTTRRLLHELQSYAADPNPALLQLSPVSDDSLYEWQAVMVGPKGTAYEGASFNLKLTIPQTYPLSPPTIHFLPPTIPVHANVHPQSGEICLDLLTKEAWSPAYTLSETLNAVQRLLGEPNPDSPLNVDVAVLMRSGDNVAVEGLVRWGIRSAQEG